MTKRTYKASGIGRKALLTSAFFLALTALAPLPAQAQKNTQQSSDAPTQAVPKDITTRAKLHTELASLYFQNGNLIIALEELTLAIAINPDYAPAYALRGVVLYHIKEFPSAESDFQKALKLNARDPEINNNYGWYLCQTGKEKESIDYFLKAIRDPLYQTPEIAHLNAGACHIKLGELDQAETATLPVFNLAVPTTLSGVDAHILDPRNTWASPEQWQEKALHLAGLFRDNFEKYTDTPAGKALISAGPQI